MQQVERGPANPRVVRHVKGLILAGVHEWGGCALDAALPRPLLPVAGQPLMNYGLRWLSDGGLAEITVCSNLSSLRLRGALRSAGGLEDALEFYQDLMPRGPAGCMLDAWCASECPTGLVMDGTLLPMFDLEPLLEAHQDTKADMTVVAASQEEHEGQLDFFPPAGIYVFSRRILDLVPSTGYVDLKETLIPQMYERGMKVLMYRPEGPALRVTGVESYLAVSQWLLESRWERPGSLEGMEVVSGGARVAASARVASGARLVGAVEVGEDCEVESGATLIGPVCVGAGTRIHGDTVICRSVVWEECDIGAGGHLDRCVVTRGACTAPGLRTRDRVLHAGNAARDRHAVP